MDSMSMPVLVATAQSVASSKRASPAGPEADAAAAGDFAVELLALSQAVTESPPAAAVDVLSAEVGMLAGEDLTAIADLPLTGQEIAAVAPFLPLSPALQPPPLAAGQQNASALSIESPSASVLTPQTAVERAALTVVTNDLAAEVNQGGSPFKTLNPNIPGGASMPVGVVSTIASAAVTAEGVSSEGDASTPIAIAEGTQTHASSRVSDGVQQLDSYIGKGSSTLPVAQPDVFSGRMHQQIAVMLSANAKHAQIAVSPPHLGPVEIRINISGDEASIMLASAHAVTREALEDALPRLRAAFADSGIALADTGVFSELPERRETRESLNDGEDYVGANGEPINDVSAPLELVRLGLVDAFV